jgi:hypothetical protein
MGVVASRVQVATTAGVLVFAIASGAPRRSSKIYNNGPNTIWIGADSSVTASNGFPILAGTSLAVDHAPLDALYAICSVLQVTPADTCVLAES